MQCSLSADVHARKFQLIDKTIFTAQLKAQNLEPNSEYSKSDACIFISLYLCYVKFYMRLIYTLI